MRIYRNGYYTSAEKFSFRNLVSILSGYWDYKMNSAQKECGFTRKFDGSWYFSSAEMFDIMLSTRGDDDGGRSSGINPSHGYGNDL